MPIIKSAKKRVRTARKAAIRNHKTKRGLKASLKKFTTKPSSKTHADAQSNVDKAVKKGLVHKNKAARLKKRAAQVAKENNVKVSPKKAPTTAAKPTAKKADTKPAAKKTVAKPTAKKADTKPVTKKAPAKKAKS